MGKPKKHMSHEKNLVWLGYIRDFTAQVYSDYNKPLFRLIKYLAPGDSSRDLFIPQTLEFTNNL